MGTANRLLKKTANWQYGFKKLREGGHLHISVENVVLFGDFPKLFSEETLDEARRRLDSAGFDPAEGARALEAELDMSDERLNQLEEYVRALADVQREIVKALLLNDEGRNMDVGGVSPFALRRGIEQLSGSASKPYAEVVEAIRGVIPTRNKVG